MTRGEIKRSDCGSGPRNVRMVFEECRPSLRANSMANTPRVRSLSLSSWHMLEKGTMINPRSPCWLAPGTRSLPQVPGTRQLAAETEQRALVFAFSLMRVRPSAVTSFLLFSWKTARGRLCTTVIHVCWGYWPPHVDSTKKDGTRTWKEGGILHAHP